MPQVVAAHGFAGREHTPCDHCPGTVRRVRGALWRLAACEAPRLTWVWVLSCRRNHGQTDRAVLKFDIDADLSSVFHWNVKQLFVFLIAEYTSDTNVRPEHVVVWLQLWGRSSPLTCSLPQALNQVVVWDHIARTPEEAIIKVKDAYNKYALIDQGSELRYVVARVYATHVYAIRSPS